MTFHDDLSRGIAIEMQVLSNIRKKYPCATLIDGYKGYDIWIPETGTGVEVKYDPMSKETGNLVVEVEMSGNPSALLATHRHCWQQKLSGGFFTMVTFFYGSDLETLFTALSRINWYM
jgi:hypothetical protein